MKTDMWGRFHHVGIVVDSRATANRIVETFWLGVEIEENQDEETFLFWDPVEAFDCECAFLVGHPMIEFIVPKPGSKLAKFLGGKSSLHHIAFKVPDVTKLKWPPIFPAPAHGARGLLVNFFTPQHGLLVEVVQEPNAETLRDWLCTQMADRR